MESSASSSQQHAISLRVMRLARPRLAQSVGVCFDPADEMSRLIEKSFDSDLSAKYPIGQFLIVPQQFENVYLGETFSFFVNCVNESSEEAREVTLKVELQTSATPRPTLCAPPPQALAPGAALSQVLSHEVKEIGQHILVCTVTYQMKEGDTQMFRKFYKFPVAKPVDVKTKFYNAEDNLSSDVYLEAQMENLCMVPLLLEKVSLDPSEYYSVRPIEPPSSLPALLRPGDTRQMLFSLSPKTQPFIPRRDITTIGKLDMEWRTTMGERGRLQTSSLQRIAPGYGELTLKILSIPDTLRIREPFDVICSLHNCREHALDLHLELDDSVSSSLLFCSPSGVSLGQIPPNGCIRFTLTLLPVALGFQSVSGLRVEDSFNKRVYEYDDIAQVFII